MHNARKPGRFPVLPPHREPKEFPLVALVAILLVSVTCLFAVRAAISQSKSAFALERIATALEHNPALCSCVTPLKE